MGNGGDLEVILWSGQHERREMVRRIKQGVSQCGPELIDKIETTDVEHCYRKHV